MDRDSNKRPDGRQNAATTAPPIIESFGLPGAGKTSLCLSLHERLGGSIEVSASGQLHRAWHALGPLQRKLITVRDALASPRLTLEMLVLTFRLGLWRSRRAIGLLARLPGTRRQFEQMRRPVPLLLDQAMLQDVWTICVSAGCTSPAPATLAPLLSELYRRISVRVLHLKAEAATAAYRVSQRKGGRSKFDGLPMADISEQMTAAEPLTPSILEAAQRAGLEVYTIDASQHPESVVAAAVNVFGGTAPSELLPAATLPFRAR